MSLVFVALLAGAVAVLIAAEWARITSRLGRDAASSRARRRRKSHLQVVPSEQDEFAASVQRDLDRLPTIEEHEHR